MHMEAPPHATLRGNSLLICSSAQPFVVWYSLSSRISYAKYSKSHSAAGNEARETTDHEMHLWREVN